MQKQLGLAIRLLVTLREIHVGEWEGLAIDEVEEQYPEHAAVGWRSRWPGRATYDELAVRVVPALVGLTQAHAG